MNILIAGCSSGIGECITKYCLEKKWRITGVDCKNPSQNINWYALDLACLDQIQLFLDNTELDFDIFIYTAGVREICKPVDLSEEKWLEVINVNLNAPFFFSRALIKNALMKEKKLNILFISSVSGMLAEPDRAAYVSSKFALNGLTKQLAFQYASSGIRVNAIAPGIIETPLTESYFKDESKVALIKKSTPVGYWGQPNHIVDIVDLCLKNDYLNGSIIVCDGGWSVGKDL